MSRKICHRDQCKLNQILEQVEALSDIVDELRRELNHLKRISFNENHENVCFESTKENDKIEYASPSVLRKVKAHLENFGASTRTDEKNSQVCKSYSTSLNHCKKKRDQEPSAIGFSTIYGSLKYLKNKIIKNIQSVQKTQQPPKNTENKCVISNQQQQYREKEKRKSFSSRKIDTRNKDIAKYTDISEKFDNSADTSFTFDASAQAEITTCSRQEDDKKSYNCNRLASQHVTENSVQVGPLSMISDDRPVIYPDRFAGELSKSHVRQMFLKNKIKKYRRCSCEGQCPYALYRLPCNRYRCSTREKKVDDEISGLTLECLSFEGKNDFPKFINVDAVRCGGCVVDSSPVEIEMNESSSSSLSVDLEIDVCNNHCDSGNIDELTKKRKARTYVVNRMRTKKDDLIKNFRAENESSFNIISSWTYISEKEDKVDEIVKNILSQRKHIYSEENNQEYKKSGKRNFINSHLPIKNNNKQNQCVIPALTTPAFNRKTSVKTSTSGFQQKGILNQSYRTIGKARYTSFPKIITSRRTKTNIQTQIDERSRLNCLQNGSLALDDCTKRCILKKIDDKNGGKKIARRNVDIDASSSQIIWPRMRRYNICSALQTEEDINIRSKEPLSQTYDLADWRDRIMSMRASCPYCGNHISAEKRKNLVALMSNPTDYRPPFKTLDFD